jgi:Na+-translocating ferredoxin:NAD+ oxidoreductase subunit G
VVLESAGQGYGGAVGAMVGISLDGKTLTGVGITTHSETPGVGSRCAEPGFRSQFAGMSAQANLTVKKDGGVVDGISGATVTSRAVAAAVRDATDFFKSNEAQIKQAIGQ